MTAPLVLTDHDLRDMRREATAFAQRYLSGLCYPEGLRLLLAAKIDCRRDLIEAGFRPEDASKLMGAFDAAANAEWRRLTLASGHVQAGTA